MSDRALVATRKGLFTIERSGKGWSIASLAFMGDNVSMVLKDPGDGSIYAALAHGHFGNKLHVSRDGGEKWEEIGVPEYPPMPADAPPEIDPVRQTPVKWSLDLIWALETGGADRPGVLWCGTVPGGLFKSEDHGKSWSLIRSLWDLPERKGWFGGGMDRPGIHSICVDARNSDRIALAVSCAGVWVTEDGGKTWAQKAHGMRAAYMPPEQANDPNVQDVHRMVRCAADPRVLWAQHHNGIFRTTDDCASWHEIENVQPSTFGFAVAVHPREPETAWFVPAIKDERRVPADGQVVVTRTRDGGRTFDVLRRGLPQQWAFDLVFRHGLDVDDSGDRLMFGSTTGSLWVSEDQGDSWQTISEHLPPVYAVRFAD